MPASRPRSSRRPGRSEYGSACRRWDHSCSFFDLLAYQLALIRPGMSPRMAASRIFVRAMPNLRNVPRGRPVMSQRLRSRLGLALRGSACRRFIASMRSSIERVWSSMIAFSSARLAAYFLTVASRLASRFLSESFAMYPSRTPCSITEREPEGSEKRLRFLVRLRGGRDADVHSPELVDLVVLDLRKDDLFLQADVVVAAAVEGTTRHAAEVAHARERHRHEAVQELVHPLAAQRDHRADGQVLADLEVGDGLAGLRHDRLLAGDLDEVADGHVDVLLVIDRFADAHVQRDLRDPRDLHHGLVAELLHQVRHDLLAVLGLETRHASSPLRLCADDGAIALEHAHLLAFDQLDADAVALARRRVEEHHVALVDRHGLVADAAGHALHRVRPHVLLDHVDALDHEVIGIDTAQHRAALALVLACDDDDFVALADAFHGFPYSTSGASDTIFMKRSVRSSRVTGPKMRVPIGSSFALSRTAALPSNLIAEPSPRRRPLAVRTTTAL